MSELQRVKVVNPGDDWIGTQYYINDKKIEHLKSVDFRVAVDEVPTFTFETIGLPDIDMSGDIRFSFTPETVTDAVKVIRNELLKHGEFYAGFWKSIASSVEEQKPSLPYRSSLAITENILNRIIGEE